MCSICGCNAPRDSRTSGNESGTHPGHRYRHGVAELARNANGDELARLIEVERSILSKNDAFALRNRLWLESRGHLALNLVSSPGAGKTSLLVETIKALSKSIPIAVVEGDQESDIDAERIRSTGISAVQINTGSGCHLDAHMVGHALVDLTESGSSVIFIENVGNLVCPSSFDLGERTKVAILSTTEGDDKPLKYPDMFAAAGVMVLSKTDLLPYVDFDAGKAVNNALSVNPDLTVFCLSAKTGDGMKPWLQWISDTAAEVAANADQGKAATISLEHGHA